MMTMPVTTENVWIEHRNEIRAFIRSKVRSDADAEDILQEVFIRIHLNLSALKDVASLRSWIYTIARNSLQDNFRKKHLMKDVSGLELSAEAETNSADKLTECVIPFIERLPRRYREALILSDFQKVPQTSIAQRLKISYSGAKSRVQRARRLLHAYLIQCCEIKTDRYGNIV